MMNLYQIKKFGTIKQKISNLCLNDRTDYLHGRPIL